MLLDNYRKDAGQDCGGDEQECGVALDTPVLHKAKLLARALGSRSSGVDGTINNALVDLVINELTTLDRSTADIVDRAVNHILVKPVCALGQWALGETSDDAGVGVVGVVLVLQQRVPGLSHLIGAGGDAA